MRIQRLIYFVVPLSFLHVSFSSYVWDERYRLQAEIPPGYVIPAKYSRVLSMGNHGLLADFLFLKAISFFGGRFIAGQSLGGGEWNYLVTSLDVITDLDPYFLDPYFLSEGLLAWDAGMPEKANAILQKGISHRPNDWWLYFFVGFNHFYFLNDYAVAADYLMRAAELPGSPSYLKTLAARLAYYGGKSKTALLFLQQMIEEADNAVLRRQLEMRLVALERAVLIEEALEKFKHKEGRMPSALNELVTLGYLDRLPEDPYGGKWGILTNGRVFSTSKFVERSEVPPGEKAEKLQH